MDHSTFEIYILLTSPLHLYGIVDYLFGEKSVVDIVKSYNYRKDEENNLEITCLHFLRILSHSSPAHTEPEAN